MFFCSIKATSSTIAITIKHETSVAKKHYTLGDIAHIEGGIREASLKELVIGISPPAGDTVNVPIQAIKSSLKRLSSNSERAIEWLGASSVKIVTNGQPIAPSLLKQKADETLSAWLASRYVNFDYELVKPVAKNTIPNGVVRVEAVIKESKKARKRMVVWLDVYVDNILSQTHRIWYRVSAEQEVLFATADINPQTPLEQQLIRKELIDVTTIAGLPVETSLANQLKFYRAKRAIEAHTAVTQNMIEKIPFVVKGQLTEVYIQQDNVGISTKAIALKNGNMNEKVLMQNPKTKGRYTATVTGKKKVVVE